MRPSRAWSAAGRAGDERDLQRGRQHVEDHGGQDEVDAARAAVDHAVQRAGLALQVEAQVQRVQVRKHAVRHVPDRALGYLQAQRWVGEGPGPARQMTRIGGEIERRLFAPMLEAFRSRNRQTHFMRVCEHALPRIMGWVMCVPQGAGVSWPQARSLCWPLAGPRMDEERVA